MSATDTLVELAVAAAVSLSHRGPRADGAIDLSLSLRRSSKLTHFCSVKVIHQQITHLAREP
jgi:hypothetical protein